MSTRAYRIIEIQTEKQSTFNCWHDTWVLDLANDQSGYNGETGMIEFERLQIESALTDKEHESPEHQEILNNILKDMTGDNSDYIQYYCY